MHPVLTALAKAMIETMEPHVEAAREQQRLAAEATRGPEPEAEAGGQATENQEAQSGPSGAEATPSAAEATSSEPVSSESEGPQEPESQEKWQAEAPKQATKPRPDEPTPQPRENDGGWGQWDRQADSEDSEDSDDSDGSDGSDDSDDSDVSNDSVDPSEKPKKPKPNHAEWTPEHLRVRLRTADDAGRSPTAPAIGLGHAANEDAETVELKKFILWAEAHVLGVLDAPGNLLGGVYVETEARPETQELPAEPTSEPHAPPSSAVSPPPEAEPMPEPAPKPSQTQATAEAQLNALIDERIAAAVAAQVETQVEARVAAAVAEQVEARVADAVAKQVETRVAEQVETRVAAAVAEQVEERIAAHMLPFAKEMRNTLAPLRSVVAGLVEKSTAKVEQRMADSLDQRVQKVEERINKLASGIANVLEEDLGAIERRLDAFAALLEEFEIVDDAEEDSEADALFETNVDPDADDEVAEVDESVADGYAAEQLSGSSSTGPPRHFAPLFVAPEVTAEDQISDEDEIDPSLYW